MASTLRLSTIDAVRTFGSEVAALIDTDAAEAIRRVRTAEVEPSVERAMRSVRAAIFIDAGAKTRQVEIVRGASRSGGSYELRGPRSQPIATTWQTA